MTTLTTRSLTILAALALAAPLGAQDASTDGDTDADADVEVVDVTPDTAVAVWQADPGRIFDASEVRLEDFRWIARPLVVFGESPFDPNFQQQMELLTARPEALIERDVVLIIDTDPDTLSDIRRTLRPRAFMLALVGKDGQIKLRKPLPWDLRELSRSIDKMPLRQQEIEARRGA